MRTSGVTMLLVLAALLVSARPVAAQHPQDSPSTAETHAEGGETAADHNGHGSSEPQPIKWATDLALWTVVVFVILLYVLRKWAWGPLAEALETRERTIRANLDDAEEARAKAQQLLEEHNRQLAAAPDEVRAILDEARRDAQHTSQQILADAQNEAQAVRDRARREIEQARDHALKEIWEQAARLATTAAGRIIAKELTEADHQRIVKEALAEFSDQSRN